MLIPITWPIPTHASKTTSRKPSLIVQSLSSLCLFISNPNHSLNIAVCSLFHQCFMPTLQVSTRRLSITGKKEWWCLFSPPPFQSLLIEPKATGYPQTKFLMLQYSKCSTLVSVRGALSIKPKHHPHPIGFPKLSLTRLSFSHRTQNPPRMDAGPSSSANCSHPLPIQVRNYPFQSSIVLERHEW